MNSFFKLFLLSILFTGLSISAEAKTIKIVKRHPNKVILVKPTAPKHARVRPHIIKVGHVWVDGYWKWNKRLRTYVWVEGRVVKAKKNKVWVSGYWRRSGNGFIYVQGRWS